MADATDVIVVGGGAAGWATALAAAEAGASVTLFEINAVSLVMGNAATSS